MGKKYDITGAYERVRSRKDTLPTIREVAKEAGAKVVYVRKVLNWNGLPFECIKDAGPSAEARLRMRKEKDAQFRQKYEALTQQLGRCPTRGEMNAAVGYMASSTQGGKVARRLELELMSTQIAQEAARGEPMEKTQTPAQYDFGHAPKIDMTKIFAIRESEETVEGVEAGRIAGEAHAASERMMIICPVCGRKKLIAPRRHPWYLRNKLGQPVFVCSAPCTGQIMT